MNINSILRVVRGIVKLRGGTDNTVIGNVGDRLKVEATVPVTPEESVMYHFKFLADSGGATDLNVDGSTTPVTFTLGPAFTGDSRDWVLDHFIIQIDDNGNVTSQDLGAIAGGITNGVLIRMKINGITHTFYNIKNNLDVLGVFGNEGTLQNTGSGFVTGNFYQGALGFIDPKMTLFASSSDEVTIQVRDDLTGLTRLRFAAHYYHKIT